MVTIFGKKLQFKDRMRESLISIAPITNGAIEFNLGHIQRTYGGYLGIIARDSSGNEIVRFNTTNQTNIIFDVPNTFSGNLYIYARNLYSNFRLFHTYYIIGTAARTVPAITEELKHKNLISLSTNICTFGTLSNDLPNETIWEKIDTLSINGPNEISEIHRWSTIRALTIGPANSLGRANTISYLHDETYYPTIRHLTITGRNTISNIPLYPIIETINITGFNTVSEVKEWSTIKELTISGYNTISELFDWPNITSITITGNNTISELFDWLNIKTINIVGNNTIETLYNWSSLTSIIINGVNTIHTVYEWPLVNQVNINGVNTISTLFSWPELTILTVTGYNTISELYPWSKLLTFNVTGNNTISFVPNYPTLTLFHLDGNNTAHIDWGASPAYFPVCRNITHIKGGASYTSSRTWVNNMVGFIIRPYYGGLTTDATQVANLIIDLSYTTWATTGTRALTILGSSLPPTPSTLLTARIAHLVSLGVVVVHN